jgi:hypothetical protein
MAGRGSNTAGAGDNCRVEVVDLRAETNGDTAGRHAPAPLVFRKPDAVRGDKPGLCSTAVAYQPPVSSSTNGSISNVFTLPSPLMSAAI